MVVVVSTNSSNMNFLYLLPTTSKSDDNYSYYCVKYDSMKELTPTKHFQHKVTILLLIDFRAINIGTLTLKITLICYSRSSINCSTVRTDFRGIFNQRSHLGIYQSASNPLMNIFILFKIEKRK